MCKKTRRDFIKLATVGAAASGAAFWPSVARAGFLDLRYTMHGDGWDSFNRRGVVGAAMDIVGAMSYDSTIRHAYRLSRTNYHLTDGTWDRTNANSYYSGLGYKDILWVQVGSLALASNRPVINIHPYESDDFDWGRADHDLVSVKFSPRGFTLDGESSIQLNHRRLGGSGTHSSPSVWAGVVYHEMLHNLGHMHGKGDYRPNLQINALQQAVFSAERGSQSIVAACQFRWGGRTR